MTSAEVGMALKRPLPDDRGLMGNGCFETIYKESCPSTTSSFRSTPSTAMRRAAQFSKRLAVRTARSHPNRQLHTSKWCILICGCCLKPGRHHVLPRSATHRQSPFASLDIRQRWKNSLQIVTCLPLLSKKRKGSGIHFVSSRKRWTSRLREGHRLHPRCRIWTK